MNAVTPRKGGRYVRDPETGEVVKQGDTDRSRIRSGTANPPRPKPPRSKAKDR